MMIYSVRMSAKSEEWSGEATENAKEIVRYFRATYPELETEMLQSMTGQLFRIAVINKFDSYSELNDWTEKLAKDDDFKKLLTKQRNGEKGKNYSLSPPVRDLWNVVSV